MRPLLLFFRAWFITLVFALAVCRYLARRLLGGRRPPDERARLLGETLARALETLGATFIKFGQILGTRPDLLPPGVIAGLARLQDDVPAAPFSEVRGVLEEELGERLGRLVTLDEVPVAAASVAQVHRGVTDDGREVAVKVLRRDAQRDIEGDLALLTFGARLVNVLPGVRYMSIPGAVESFAKALRQQVDFRIEAANNRRLTANFAGDPKVALPALVEELSTSRVLVMEFVHGIKPTEVKVDRPGLALAGFRAIAKMVFLDGFVHADMHPGNMMFTEDGRVFLIDTGLCAEIPEELRKPWVDTFTAVVLSDGERAAELFWGYAPEVKSDDFAAFARDIEAHLGRLKGRPIHEIEVTEAVGGAMAILRRHRVQVDPVFTVVNLAMLVAEGIGKQLDPGFDLYGAAMPFLLEAALKYPTGKPPLRSVARAS